MSFSGSSQWLMMAGTGAFATGESTGYVGPIDVPPFNPSNMPSLARVLRSAPHEHCVEGEERRG